MGSFTDFRGRISRMKWRLKLHMIALGISFARHNGANGSEMAHVEVRATSGGDRPTHACGFVAEECLVGSD